MKNLTLIFALLFSLTAFAKVPNTATPTIKLGSIFFTNQNDDLLFIDFETISDKIIEVKVLCNHEIVMVEDVAELDQNMIYEIDLSLFQKGHYSIEIETEDHTKIVKEIDINTKF